MDVFRKLGLFSRTVDGQFVFNLFDLLLCGIIILVILRAWRAQARPAPNSNHVILLLAFSALGASFALAGFVSGAFLFSHIRLAVDRFDLPITVVRSGLAFALGVFYYRRFGGQRMKSGAVALLLLAAALHVGLAVGMWARHAEVLWNLEQFAWLLSLFSFALAIGEAGTDLLDRVSVRLQVAFVLLASLMILVILQTEKAEYQADIRSRSSQLAQFVRAQVEYHLERNEPLSAVIGQEDLLERLTLGFGELRELKLLRILADGQIASFEISGDGMIHRNLEAAPQDGAWREIDPEERFLMQSLPLRRGPIAAVEFYGARTFLHERLRRRIVLIFSLFSGMVLLSTLMIGLVVRDASSTIRQQAREIEETQRRLMQTSKLAAIGQLAAGVAHEINNPVTAILTRAGFLASAERADGDREDLEAIVVQAQRIAQITRGLLVFSRPQALNLKPVSIDGVVQASLRSVSEALGSGQVTVDMDMAADLPRVMADEGNLVRALENLFRNAIDAMPTGGNLRIHVGHCGQRLRLEIEDSGTGIPQDNLPRIFDPFFTTKEVGKGTGLGLSIVHGIIEEHRGTIEVNSRAGAGACFEITLPTEEST